MTRRSLLVLIVFVCSVGLDQCTKYLARIFLLSQQPVAFLFGSIKLHYVENYEGFLGYLAAVPASARYHLLTTGVGLLLFVIFLGLYRHNKLRSFHRITATLVMAGGTGNLLDRLMNDGGVIDFIVLGTGQLTTGAFNLADMYILFGSFCLGCSLANSVQLHVISRK